MTSTSETNRSNNYNSKINALSTQKDSIIHMLWSKYFIEKVKTSLQTSIQIQWIEVSPKEENTSWTYEAWSYELMIPACGQG
jgi:hypothetical protein